jgi:phosphoribosylformimino-5-aminoimidazole carboxamide ribotide isomerase
MGASHIIITSFVFPDAKFSYERIKELIKITGKDRLVLDLSCRRRGNDFFVVMNKWRTFTDVKVTAETLKQLSNYCDEFLVHSVDVEGKKAGINVELLKILSEALVVPITYAGGITSMADLELIKEAGKKMIDFTIGSALDIFGGTIEYAKVVNWLKQQV